MNCKDFEEQIVLFPELSNEERAIVTEHLNSCASCMELFNSVTETVNVLREIGKVNIEIQDPFRLTNIIMARIKAKKSQPWSLFNLSFLRFELAQVKYAMSVASFLLVFTFGIEQFQSSEISGTAVSSSNSKMVILNRRTFQEELSKSKTSVLILANNCKSPFNIGKVNKDCLKQRMTFQ